MKTKLLILLFISVSCSINSQVTTVVEGTFSPGKLVKQGDVIYFTEFGPAPEANSIAAYDLTTGIKSNFLSGLESTWALFMNETEFYVAEYAVFNNDKIYSGELADPNGTLEELLPFGEVIDFELVDDTLYILTLATGRLYKLDVSISNAEPELVLNNLSFPYDLFLQDNDLFIVEAFGNGVSKIDITDSTPSLTTVIGGLDFPDSMVIVGTDAYITEFNLGSVIRVDLMDPNLEIETVVNGLSGPSSIIADGMDIYISETQANKISTFNINEILSLENQDVFSDIKVYPNPSNSDINILGLDKMETFSVYDILGKEVLSGTVSSTDKISIEFLANGVYTIKINLESGVIIRRFIKE